MLQNFRNRTRKMDRHHLPRSEVSLIGYLQSITPLKFDNEKAQTHAQGHASDTSSALHCIRFICERSTRWKLLPEAYATPAKKLHVYAVAKIRVNVLSVLRNCKQFCLHQCMEEITRAHTFDHWPLTMWGWFTKAEGHKNRGMLLHKSPPWVPDTTHTASLDF
jgi:hypothetical protein